MRSRIFNFLAQLSRSRLGPLACGLLLTPLLNAAPGPELNAIPLTQRPLIDGNVLADPAWRDQAAASGFIQVRPFEGQPASEKTQVYVGYTNDTLYIAAVCFDEQPGSIISSDSRRDAELDESDSFQVIIDSFADGQNGLLFGTNPTGMEYDGQVARQGASGGVNLNWNTTWQVKSKIGKHGWSTELAIPFRSLRFKGKGLQHWRMNFKRNIRRKNEVVYWSPLPRQYGISRVSLAGTVSNIKVPRQRNLKVTPYALGSTVRGGNVNGTETNEEFGVDIKYSLSPSLTLDATYNTDFAQVEVDDIQVNLNRFSLFFPEKRPFFLENSGQFTVGTPKEVELFFSRRIGIGASGNALPIEGGLRLSGKVGERTNVGLLRMRSEARRDLAPRNDFTVARVSQEFGNRTTLGAIFVNRRGDGSFDVAKRDDKNSAYALDGTLGIGEDFVLNGYLAKTDSPTIDEDDHAAHLGITGTTALWSSALSYTEVGAGFNPEVGFLRRSDYRKGSAFLLRRYRPKDLWGLHELRPHISYQGFWNFDGLHESGFLHVDNHFEWRSGLEIHTGMNVTHERVLDPFEIVEGVRVPAGNYNHKELQLVYQTNKAAPLSLDLTVRAGGLFGGDRVSVIPTVAYRYRDRFSSELSWSHNDIDLPVTDGHFKLNVGSLRLTYSFTPKIQLQALVQYNDRDDVIATNLRFAWLQDGNAGLYLVYNEIDERGFGAPAQPRREFVLKYSRILDLLR